MNYEKQTTATIEETPTQGIYITKNAVAGSLLGVLFMGFLAGLKWKKRK